MTVQFCAWCPVYDAPDPRSHPNGQPEHIVLDETWKRIAAYHAARTWAEEHRHDQPDDRMLDAAIDAYLAARTGNDQARTDSTSHSSNGPA